MTVIFGTTSRIRFAFAKTNVENQGEFSNEETIIGSAFATMTKFSPEEELNERFISEYSSYIDHLTLFTSDTDKETTGKRNKGLCARPIFFYLFRGE